MATEPIRFRVHDTTEGHLSGVLRVLSEARRGGSLHGTLHTLCEAVASTFEADVVSVYVRVEETGELIMRGNVGFPSGAVGTVRLRPGEGLTGLAAECLRPVSVSTAPRDSRFKPVPGLDEERFPTFLAVPLIAGTNLACGVLVLQRRGRDGFSLHDVELVTALSAAFAGAVSRSSAAPSRGAPRGHRSVRLAGVSVVRGTALGAACTLPTFEGLSHDEPATAETTGDAAGRAFDALRVQLGDTLRRLEADDASFLLFEDARLGASIREECARLGIARGMREVARRYALTPFRVDGVDEEATRWLRERAADVEDLCLLAAAAARDARVLPGPGRVLLLPERITSCVALLAVAERVSAVVVGAPVAADGAAARLLQRAGIPVIAEVAGLFSWVRPNDRLMVDGEGGHVRVDPGPGEVVSHRRHRRSRHVRAR